MESRADWRVRREEPRSLPVAEILTLPPPTTPFPCRVEVSHRGTLLGSDLGIVTFIDGWLGFEGHRPSFSLRRPDVEDRTDGALKLAEGERIVFLPQDWLVAEGLDEIDLKRRFRANLASWMRSDPPRGESVMPPLESHPTGIARAWSQLAVCGLAGWSLFSYPYVATQGVLLAWPFALGALQALRDLWRLESLAPSPSVLEERT